MLPLWLAPRVYLDTSVLIELAEQRKHADHCREVLRLFKSTRAVLVLSLAHFLDLGHATDRSSVTRILNFVDQFPRKAIADDPSAAEIALVDPWLHGDHAATTWSDIRPKPLRSAREFAVRSEPQLACYRMMSPLFSLMSDGVSLMKIPGVVNPAGSPRKQKEKWRDDFSSAVQTGSMGDLMAGMPQALRENGLSETDAQNVVAVLSDLMDRLSSPDHMDAVLRTAGQTLSVDERIQRAVLKKVRPVIGPGTIVESGLRKFRESATRLGGDVEVAAATMYRETNRPKADISWMAVPKGEERWHEVAPGIAPGSYLGNALAYYRTRDRSARALDSDWIDGMHVVFVPYVDIATVDSANFQRIESTHRLLGERRGLRRSGKLFRNRDHKALLDALRGLA